MSGDLLVFGDDTYVEKNLIYNALFEQSPYYDIVEEVYLKHYMTQNNVHFSCKK
jgi:hypothetical protein